MSDQLVREAIAEKERLRDRVTDADRFGRAESAIAVLQTRFEAWIARAVQGEDLKELRREMEGEVEKLVNNLRAYFAEVNEQQSRNILGEVNGMLANQRNAQAEDQKSLRRQVGFMLLGTVMSILGALVIFYLTQQQHN